MDKSQSLFEKIIAVFEKTARERVAKELLVLSDGQLTELGYSRGKLQQGAKAWPWVVEGKADTTAEILTPTFSQTTTDHPQDDHTPLAA